MKERWEPAPSFPAEPTLNESEQYPTSQYNSPPVPSFASLLPRGLVGYAEMKKEQLREATLDRKMSDLAKADEDLSEVQRWALVAKLACRFPQIGVQQIADGVVPWDLETFKRLVAEAQTRYLKEFC